uniref:tudor domain-containing protein 7 n=1 Tax=Euleptes europaea TaxID=460621 RepID=UPI0025420094|nr:tudor domain-containing protein 7 [Euleptes europaea]
MQEADLVAKMLRAVLQSHKDGVPFSHLQGEYKSLTGDWIPFKLLGHPSLEAYLKSVPGVVRIEIGKTGEVTCHAVACQETARIAQLVARQRTSRKKSGRQVNCRMRLKRSAPLALVGKPKCTLRKPGFTSPAENSERPMLPLLQSRGGHAVFRPCVSGPPYPLSPAFRSAESREVLIQGHMTVMNRPEKRLVLPPRFQKELQAHLSRNLSCDLNANEARCVIQALPACPSNVNIIEVQRRVREILNRFPSGIWLSKLPHLYKEVYKEDFNPALLPQFEYWPHVCIAQKVCSGGHRDILLFPVPKTHLPVKSALSQEGKPQSTLIKEPTQNKGAAASHGDLKQKIAAILLNYSSGLWANALPKVYEDTYKATFPQDVLNHLDSLSDVCTVDYVAGNPKKAILYAKSKENTKPVNATCKVHEDLKRVAEQEASAIIQEPQEESSEDTTVPPLIVPAETSPSVLVVELDNTNEVVIRYVGKDYSAAQESMEDEMKDYYCQQNPSVFPVQSVKVGQLVAVPAEEDAWLRAKIVAVEGNRIKVCYVDYGFNESIENTKVYKLAKQFYSLPFQASKCKLAGLESFCDDHVLVKMVDSQTCGKIFAVEILEKSDIPLVVLYDTSGEDDININAACLKALCDKSLELHLQVNALYTNVRVTNVCSDGTLYCQVPSKGLAKLSECLQKLENYFHHKVITSKCSVSLPYCGKICLFNSKGKWARVEITSVHSSRALDVQFMDTGTVASVKVAELREVPPSFLREIVAIPPQATKCCLADLPLHIGMWTPDAVLWLRDTVLNCPDCSIKVVKLDKSHRIAHIYLFTPKNFPDPDRSINRQITNADLWKHQKDVFLSVSSSGFPLGKGKMDFPQWRNVNAEKGPAGSVPPAAEPGGVKAASDMPPPLPLPKPGEQMDIFVSLACHPGYFVFQPWQEMHSLEVLMEEMLLYYSRAEERRVAVEKNKLYAAKVENRWYRVIIKGALANGLVSVYELDYGKHELVSIQKVQPLPDVFQKLPFQAITAQLAGVDRQQWSEEAAVVFRNNVEKKALVAQLQAVVDGANPWDRKVITYLVDTSLPETDIWIHDLMTQYYMEISKA